ncbi:MAG: protoporphyrinogen oxidase [Acidobacteria bacterium]|nr:protoporphyrinogen oxidase [Acidobacteriota bacterium]NIM61426.1 protoporphyrinogen oxidase [Acidobacteriota bacterium]NIO58089.1 protoporphyrinogen oxidase [Acidobacteriota bacterium]NIQ29098.1 protoporphyrinogen oxidase [Acidobacteriota bacterium]NIQ83642.1 protoporphyrinogen oxidase [Acidobacteriota bacterium]
MSERPRIVIVGAGISGLTAAYRLAEAFDITVLEAADRAGGHIRTEERGGLLLEWGPDSLVAHKPAGERLCRELGLGSRLLRLRSGGSRMQVVTGGRLQQVPEGYLMIAPTRMMPLIRSPLLSPLGRTRAALERMIPARRDEADESLQSFVTRRWGQEAYERVAEPVFGGLFAADATRLSAQACVPRMHALENTYGNVATGLRKMMAAHGAGNRPRAGVYALDGGMSVLVEALEQRLPDGALRFRTSVCDLQRGGAGWRLLLDGGETLDADAVVLACPAFVASRLLRATAPELAAQLDAVEYASCATVNLLYDASAMRTPLHGFGFFVARSENSPLLACNYASLKFDGRAPLGCVLLRAFLGGAGRASLDGLDDGQLVRVAHEGLAALLDLRGAPRFGRARRFIDALPQPVVGIGQTRERLAAGSDRLALCGSACGWVGLPDCIESAEKAAERVAEETARSEGIERAG